MHYERTEQTHETILSMCISGMTCAQIAERLGYSRQRTMYHLRQLIADHSLNVSRAVGRMNSETFMYQTNTSGIVINSLNKTVGKILLPEPISRRSAEEQAKSGYEAGSAMRNVKNLAEKLKRQSQMMRAERKSSRTYVGVSSVYNG